MHYPYILTVHLDNSNERPFQLLVVMYAEKYRPATKFQPAEGGEVFIDQVFLVGKKGTKIELPLNHRLVADNAEIIEAYFFETGEDYDAY